MLPTDVEREPSRDFSCDAGWCPGTQLNAPFKAVVVAFDDSREPAPGLPPLGEASRLARWAELLARIKVAGGSSPSTQRTTRASGSDSPGSDPELDLGVCEPSELKDELAFSESPLLDEPPEAPACAAPGAASATLGLRRLL